MPKVVNAKRTLILLYCVLMLAFECIGQMKLLGVTSKVECPLALFTRHLR